MKINLLEIQAFGPFKDLQRIDFNALSVDGLFMLEGPTGSGKSSIIDALVWALYGTTAHQAASKQASTSYGQRIRSDYATASEETKVVLEFSAGGKQYRIKRTAKYEAVKTRGEGIREIPEKASLEFLSSKREALTRIKEIASEVFDILQMDADQFSQLVVLPQGDFASFLHATSEQRQEVLKRIFKTYFYKNFVDDLEIRRKELNAHLLNLKNEISFHGKNLIAEANLIDPSINTTDLLEQLADPNLDNAKKLQRIKQVSEKITPNTKGDRAKAAEIEKKIKPLAAEVNRLEESASTLEQKESALAKRAELLERSEEIEEYEEWIKDIRKASRLESKLQSFRDAENKREEALSDLDQELHKKSLQWLNARIKVLEPKFSALTSELAKYENVDDQLDELTTLYENTLADEKSISSITQLKNKVLAAEKKFASQKQKISNFKEKRKDSYAHLVKLTKNQPCPVCGSLHHPKPISGKSPYSEKALTALENQLGVMQDNLSQLKNHLQSALKLKKKKFTPSAKLLSRIKELTTAQKKLTKLKNDHYEVEQELQLLQDNKQYLFDYTRYTKEADLLEDRLLSALKSAGIEDLDSLEELLDLDPADYESEVSSYREELSGLNALLGQASFKALPKQEALRNAIDRKRSELDKLNSALGVVRDRLSQSKDRISRINAAVSGVGSNLKEVEKELSAGAPYLSLDRWVQGANKFHLTLENFVLQERLELILERASLILMKISHGKYEFRMSEERVGRQQRAGLGITVKDHFAGKERAAETLSGGETFYASLSLALGLADVIKASRGGVELGTLFIDEGFGSLSDERLDEVLNVLEDLRSTDRIIGIISHVEGMKSQIPLRLEVRPTDAGPSRVRMAVTGVK